MRRWLLTLLLTLWIVAFSCLGFYVFSGVCDELENVNQLRVSTNFTLADFESPDTGEVKIDPRLAGICEQLYAICPISISSAYRTPEWNKKVNGAFNSYHMKGLAVDIQPICAPRLMKIELIELFKEACKIYSIEAIGLCKNHLHIDLRDRGKRDRLCWVKLSDEPHWGFYYYYGRKGEEEALAHFEKYYEKYR